MTIKEIAREAGISKSTVSRVLNNHGYVSAEARKKVEKVIARNVWTPSAAAVTLSKKEGQTIGVVIPEIDNEFYGEVLKGITRVADSLGLSIIYCDTQNDGANELRYLAALSQQYVRGIIMAPALGYTDPEDFSRLKEALGRLSMPVVILDRDFDYDQLDGVFYQNFESGYLATKALIEAGNRTIGILQGDMELKIARERYRGYEEAMRENGLEIDRRFVLNGRFKVETSYAVVRDMIASGCLPEGFVTCNNRSTIGFLKALTERGLRIGHDIALVGIDDIAVVNSLCPNYSCIARDNAQMGVLAMETLVNRLAEPDQPKSIRVVPAKVCMRGSEKRE